MTATALEPLGRAALTPDELTALVRTVTGEPLAVPAELHVEPVDYLIGTPTTEALLRVVGTARLPDGQTTGWSCFVKQLQSARHWSFLDVVPAELREVFIRNIPWQLEIAVHTGDLDQVLPEGLRLARLYRIDEYEDERGTLWMEDVVQEQGIWPLERFERAAFLLGRLSARRQTHLVRPLLPRDGVETPGVGLRYYTENRVLQGAVPALADEATWRHPLLAAAVDATGEHELRTDLLALAEQLPAVLDALDTVPQCYQHGDASPQNLLVPNGSPDEFVAIDWGFDCPQAVGFDLGQLLVGLAHAGELAPSALPAVHKVILAAFLEGLAADGMDVTAEQVRFGYLGSLLARATFTAIPVELFGLSPGPANEAVFEQRVLLTRALVDLVQPVV
ncbi:phosphotransferase family enzyme [Kribbella amoyensis]|uniref:Phosphotransferase family enzyme n=1 Tax=Kribbella amoyensis TaxID=996641 RepID=A0A561B3D6_9ACTN|nr:phosphotransferase [Kribbella amoyensis]TWD73386.1 phosphotransferase family enzyme [Kribbella amoyensis]